MKEREEKAADWCVELLRKKRLKTRNTRLDFSDSYFFYSWEEQSSIDGPNGPNGDLFQSISIRTQFRNSIFSEKKLCSYGEFPVNTKNKAALGHHSACCDYPADYAANGRLESSEGSAEDNDQGDGGGGGENTEVGTLRSEH